MNLKLQINKVPLVLGAEMSDEMLAAAAFRQTSLWRRLAQRQPADQTIYDLDDCEFKGLDDSLHIYPCTHRYLNHDRRWNTRVTLYLKNRRLERLLLQVVEGQTAAMTFMDRFSAAATAIIGPPCQEDRFRRCWQGHGTRIEAKLHHNRTDADFDIALAPDITHGSAG